MYPIGAPFDNIGRDQLRQIFEPQARRLGFTMTELPRLNDLIRFTNLAADDAHGVLQSDLRNRGVKQEPNKR